DTWLVGHPRELHAHGHAAPGAGIAAAWRPVRRRTRLRPDLHPAGHSIDARGAGGGLRHHRRLAHAARAGRAPVPVVDRHGAAHRGHGAGRDAGVRAPAGDRGAGDADRGEIDMKLTTFDEFKELAQRGTFVPVYKEIVADLLTPVSAFLKIAEDSDHAFLLESVEGGEQVARYSFLGKDPFLILRARGGKTIVRQSGETREENMPFIAKLREVMAKYRSPFVPGLPRFTGGAV